MEQIQNILVYHSGAKAIFTHSTIVNLVAGEQLAYHFNFCQGIVIEQGWKLLEGLPNTHLPLVLQEFFNVAQLKV